MQTAICANNGKFNPNSFFKHLKISGQNIGYNKEMFENGLYNVVIDRIEIFAKDIQNLGKLSKIYLRLKDDNQFYFNRKENKAEIRTENFFFESKNENITDILNELINAETYIKKIRKRFPETVLVRKKYKSSSELNYILKIDKIEIYHKDLEIVKKIFRKLRNKLKEPVKLTKDFNVYQVEKSGNIFKITEKQITKFIENLNSKSGVQLRLNI